MAKINKALFFTLLLASFPSLAAAQQATPVESSPSGTISAGAAFAVRIKVKGLGSDDAVRLANRADVINATSDGWYKFPTLLSNGAKYSVVPTTPYSPDISCTAANPAGTIAGADVTVLVTCTQNIESGAIQSANGSQAGGQVDNNGANNSAASSAGDSNGSAPSLGNGADNSPDLSLPGQGPGQQSQAAENSSAPTLDNSGDMANGGGDLTLPSASSAQNKGAAGQGLNQQSVKQQSQQAPTISLTKDETSPFTLLKGVPLKSGSETPPILFKLSPNVITVDPPKKGLPQGLKLSRNKDMEEITGTPATTSPKAPYTITVYNKANERASITIDILVEDRPTIKLEPGQALPFLLSAGIALSKTEKYNKPIYFKISAHVASIVPTPALPTGLKFSINGNGEGKTAEILGTPSYSPATQYKLVAYDKNNGASKPLYIKITVTACGDDVVQPVSNYASLADDGGSAPNATPAIQTCIQNAESYDKNTKGARGGHIGFRPGIYLLKTQLNLTPDNVDITSFTFRTEGVTVQRGGCKPPPDPAHSGSLVVEYHHSSDSPDCAIFLAEKDFPSNSPIDGNGGVFWSSKMISHSRFDHIILDGNHRNRGSGALYNACVATQNGQQTVPRGFNVSFNTQYTIFDHWQSMHALCASSMSAGPGDQILNSFLGHNGGSDGGLTSHFWSDGLTTGADNGLVVYNTVIEDVHDVGFVLGGIAQICPQPPSASGVPAKITHNYFIQGYKTDTTKSVMEVEFNDWGYSQDPPQWAYYNNTCGGKSAVNDNFFNCAGSGAGEGNAYCGSAIRFGNENGGQGNVYGGEAESNNIACTGGGAVGFGQNITYNEAHGYTVSGNSMSSSCSRLP